MITKCDVRANSARAQTVSVMFSVNTQEDDGISGSSP